jgi:hypothetical protein
VGEAYDAALKALIEAHNACYRAWEKSEPRLPIDMSSGPFAGANVALGIIRRLESENEKLWHKLKSLEPSSRPT